MHGNLLEQNFPVQNALPAQDTQMQRDPIQGNRPVFHEKA
jgi:hypothetical protein